MTHAGLCVALLSAPGAEATAAATALAGALRDTGHEPSLVDPRPVGPVEGALRRRGFTDGLTRVPGALRALVTGGFDVAHAFTPADALAARAWRRVGGGPVVFTCAEVLDRDRLADRRLRLRLLAAALDDSDAVVAADRTVAAALERWMAVEAVVVDAADGEGHAAIYRRVISA